MAAALSWVVPDARGRLMFEFAIDTWAVRTIHDLSL
jgi:hypothetical protein